MGKNDYFLEGRWAVMKSLPPHSKK